MVDDLLIFRHIVDLTIKLTDILETKLINNTYYDKNN